MAVQTQFQFRRGTAAQWTSANPTLAAGEFGYETDTGKAKIGNGSTAWSSLSYAITGEVGDITEVQAGTGISITNGTGPIPTVAIDSTVATLTGSQTLTNKTLTSPVISSISNTGTITVPTSTGTLALTSGVINNTLTTTTGDMIYASSANTPARLAVGSTGQVLTVAGGVPTWATASSGAAANDPSLAFGVQIYS